MSTSYRFAASGAPGGRRRGGLAALAASARGLLGRSVTGAAHGAPIASFESIRSAFHRTVAPGEPPRPRLVQRTFDLLLRRRTALGPAQQERLFQLFSELHRARPSLLPGVARVPDAPRHFLVSAFSCPLLRRYDGFELAVTDGRSAVYYRMPGARAGAGGRVPRGHHALRIDHWNLPGPLYLELDSLPTGGARGDRDGSGDGGDGGGGLQVRALSTAAAPGTSYRPLEGHFLDQAKLNVELEEQVYRWLLWHLLSAAQAPLALEELGGAALHGWLRTCAALGPRLSALAEELARYAPPNPAAAPGAHPRRSP